MVIRNSIVTLFFRIVGVGLGYASHLLLANQMSTNAYGTFMYVFAWLSILLLVSQLGTENGLVPSIVRCLDKKNPRRANSYLVTSLFVCAGAALICGALLGLGLKMFYEGSAFLWVTLAVLLPLMSVNTSFLAVFKSLNEIVISRGVSEVLEPVTFILLILGMVFFKVPLSPALAYGLKLVAGLLLTATFAYLLKKRWPFRFQRWPGLYTSGNLLSTSFPLLALSVGHVALGQADSIMIGIMRSPSDVALYAVAAKLASVVGLILYSVNIAGAATISSLYYSGNREVLSKTVQRLSLFLLASVAGISMTLLFSGHILLGLFGAEYVHAYPAFVILLGSYSLAALFGPLHLLLSMTGHQKDAALSMLAALALNVILNLFWIPSRGIEGAALASLIAAMAWNANMLWIAFSKLKINPTWFGILTSRTA